MQDKVAAEAKAAVCAMFGYDVGPGHYPDLDTAFAALCRAEQIYRHKKGGVYRRLFDARSSDDEGAVVVYEHLWPHARGYWVRRAAEFNEPERFARL